MQKCDTLVCGAGIAGIATAYFLACRYGCKDIVLIDRDQPMSYTSAMSGENFRDYWPQPCMAAFVGRSIELMSQLYEQSDQAFDMRFFGYDFVSLLKEREIFPSRHLRDPARTNELDTIRDTANRSGQ